MRIPTNKELEQLLEDLKGLGSCTGAEKCPKCQLKAIFYGNPNIVEVCLGSALSGNPEAVLDNLASTFLLGYAHALKTLEVETLEELMLKDEV